jgi:hypothetical protein
MEQRFCLSPDNGSGSGSDGPRSGYQYRQVALTRDELDQVDVMAGQRRLSRAQMLALLVGRGLEAERRRDEIIAKVEAGETQISAGFASGGGNA